MDRILWQSLIKKVEFFNNTLIKYEFYVFSAIKFMFC